MLLVVVTLLKLLVALLRTVVMLLPLRLVIEEGLLMLPL